jgi:hypothetical protein
MPLRAEGEAGSADAAVSLGTLPEPDRLAAVPAPWADWAERRSTCGPGFLPSLAFLAWLEGFAVSYQSLADGRPLYGVADLAQGRACWLGSKEWRVTGEAARDLGRHLWRRFLDLGGPWPTEFRLRAAPRDRPLEEPQPGVLAYRREGPRCRQLWELVEPRQRAAEF